MKESSTNDQSTSGEYVLNTGEFAALNKVRGSSVLQRYSSHGSYFGIVPKKLANRRLVWPNTLALHENGVGK